MKHWQLKQMQKLPLEVKVQKTLLRIKEWYEHWDGMVYVSCSGGKDSLILLNLVRSIYPEVPGVFVDTGLEFPELREFVKNLENIIWIKPKMTFKQVIEKYGYPVVSKKVSSTIYKLRHQKLSERYRNYLLNGDERGTAGKLPEKWKYLLDAPFMISDKCCSVMKKNPLNSYSKRSGRVPLTAEIAEESRDREKQYLNNGCNAFDFKHPKSTPMAFWTEQDVLQYLFEHKISCCSVYGDIVKDQVNGIVNYRTTLNKRTGCMYCLMGINYEGTPNRIQIMARTHATCYKFLIENLGIGKVLDYMNIPYYADTSINCITEYSKDKIEQLKMVI